MMEMLKCSICEKTFKNKSGLSAHVRVIHKTPWEEYQEKYPNDESKSFEPPKEEPPQPPLQEYATVKDVNTLRKDIQYLAASISKEPSSNPSNETSSNPDVEVAELADFTEVIDPSMNLETENPLEASKASVIELEGSIISRKTVGFTPKSLMLFDLTRKKGFRGNFADFVNSCITSALKGRKFKLTVEEDVD